MFNISLYLEKFKILGLGEVLAKDAMISVLEKLVGVKIERKDIEYKNGMFRIKAEPIVKSQIYIKKNEILELLSQELKKNVKDVR